MLKIIKTILLYLIFILFLTFIFSHTLFPGKKASLYFSDLISKKTGISVYIDDIELKIPLKIKLIKPVINSKDINNLELKFIEFNPSITSLLTGKASFKIKAAGLDGGIDAYVTAGIKNYKNNFSIDLKFLKINLKKIEKVLKKNNLEISGIASGRIKIDYKDKKGSFGAYSDFANLAFKSDKLIVPLDVLGINRLELKGDIDDKNLILNNSSLRSKAGLTNFSGNIRPLNPLTRSIFDLEGKIVPDLGYLGKKRSDPTLSMIFTMIKGKRDLKYSIGGNLMNPRLRLK